MKKRGSLSLILFFAGLTLVTTWFVIFAWEQLLREPYFSWVEARYPGQKLKQYNIQQRGEHFFISTSVDIIVVSMLLRLVGRQQRKLLRAEERYRAVFEHATDGIGIVAARDHRIVDANHRFAEMLGYSSDQIVGGDFSHLVGSAGDSSDHDRRQTDRMGAGVSEIEIPIATEGGATFAD